MIEKIKHFLHKEPASGIIMVLAAILALICVNSPLSYIYDQLLSVELVIKIGKLGVDKPILLWINDGLMAVFFLVVGLEVKREFLSGELSSPSKVLLPAVAAVGGMVAPAAVYVLMNYEDPLALQGWAIPAATDIAFALGVLSLLGNRVPPSLKIFLMALAIIDDLGAIIIIAIFYSSDLSIESIIAASICLVTLILLNRFKVLRLGPYMVVGTIMWVCVLKSGVHATLAGVLIAFTIPLRTGNHTVLSPLHKLETGLHGWVAFAILPIFAFANAGVGLSMDDLKSVTDSIPLGVIGGLFIGKQLGVFGFTWLLVKLGLATLPSHATWRQLYGVALLCGIGFTMSLFIGSLAFEQLGSDYLMTDRIGILFGSLLSGIAGYLVLKDAPNNQKSLAN
ncbi:Na+/H+ antiporter NhaA [Zooshikella harenae]|uniref:Na(+)/H(+) antiporter NhaA n=1 Tax=Zooshikella harenae TaxID=2827238 RepID=A0ABS5ZD83_9GAMM|nr:Na+/H+ antiporter NhaA [Zooshikella harenae]MBU2711286.1 Na+/H+ antiporter NhaA [Zooshikella harenae]